MNKKICDCGVSMTSRRHRVINPRRIRERFPLPAIATLRVYGNPPICFGLEATVGILRNFVTGGTAGAVVVAS